MACGLKAGIGGKLCHQLACFAVAAASKAVLLGVRGQQPLLLAPAATRKHGQFRKRLVKGLVAMVYWTGGSPWRTTLKAMDDMPVMMLCNT